MEDVPRKPRLDFEGAIQSITTRGVARSALFRDDADSHRMLDLVAQVTARYEWDCLTYCLMGNHVHLLVRTRKATLSRGMQWLSGRYATLFNERHGRDGHLHQGRFRSDVIDSDEYLRNVARYIAWNPVTAGLCLDPLDWRWSAHRALVGGGSPLPVRTGALLEYVGGPDAYRRLVDLGPVNLDRLVPLKQLVKGLPRQEAAVRARAAGYELAEIAKVLGCDRRTINRAIARAAA